MSGSLIVCLYSSLTSFNHQYCILCTIFFSSLKGLLMPLCFLCSWFCLIYIFNIVSLLSSFLSVSSLFCNFCLTIVTLFSAANMKKCRARYGLDQQNLWCKPCRFVLKENTLPILTCKFPDRLFKAVKSFLCYLRKCRWLGTVQLYNLSNCTSWCITEQF
jgi:hypothetical protein